MPGATKSTYTYDAGGGSTGKGTIIQNDQVYISREVASGGTTESRSHRVQRDIGNEDYNFVFHAKGSNLAGEWSDTIIFGGNHQVHIQSLHSSTEDFRSVETVNQQGSNTLQWFGSGPPDFHVNTHYDLVI